MASSSSAPPAEDEGVVAYALRKVFSNPFDGGDQSSNSNDASTGSQSSASASVATASAAAAGEEEGVLAYALRRVFSNPDHDQNQGNNNVATSATQNKEQRSQPHLSNAQPLSRTKSTPHPTTTTSNQIAYAMRKVFSREEESEWHQQEAIDLVRSDSLQHDEEGEELTLDESKLYNVNLGEDDLEDVDDVQFQKDNAAIAKTMLKEKAKRDKVTSKGYQLRRFLSTPNHATRGSPARKLRGASVLRRTPSYEPEGYDEYGDVEYNESPLYASHNPRGGPRKESSSLSNSVALKRTPISFRREQSELRKQKQLQRKGGDDDLTVAESIDDLHYNDYQHGNNKKRRFYVGKSTVLLVFFMALLGAIGVTCYLIVGKQNRSKIDSNSLVTWEMGSSNDIAINWDTDQGEDTPKPTQRPRPRPTPPPTQRPRPQPTPRPNPTPAAKPQVSWTDPLIPLPDISWDLSGTTTVTNTNINNKPTPNPTDKPVQETYTSFYLIADCPYDDNERENLMPKYISGLKASDGEFLVHLGDLMYAKEDYCSDYAYNAAYSILKKSPVPTFVLPGDNDINDCPDHEDGEEKWMKYMHKFDEQWDHDIGPITRWGDLDESFSFLRKGVLYFGLNIIGGSPYSWSEKERRHALHLRRIRSILSQLDEDEYQVIVLLGHADPGSKHEDFFEGSNGFVAMVEKTNKPVIHFHGDSHEYYEVEGDFGYDKYMRISLDGESWAPPLRVEIDVSKKNPVRVSRRRKDLDVECCKDGWPRHDEL